VEPRWQPLVDRSVGVLQALMGKTGWRSQDVGEVVLVGGATLTPMVRQAFATMFGAPLVTTDWANVAVVAGAATVASAA
jgi:molecular chaperone DnaK (HSP70)